MLEIEYILEFFLCFSSPHKTKLANMTKSISDGVQSARPILPHWLPR